MSKIIYFTLAVSLNLQTIATPVTESLDQLNNKTKEFYCTAIDLKDAISRLIQVR